MYLLLTYVYFYKPILTNVYLIHSNPTKMAQELHGFEDFALIRKLKKFQMT